MSRVIQLANIARQLRLRSAPSRGRRPTGRDRRRASRSSSRAVRARGVGRAAPAGLGAGERPRGLAGGEALVLLLDAHVARLQQAAEVAGGEVGLDPVAEAEQRAAGTRRRRRDAGPERDGPVVAQRLLPDQRDVRVGGAGDLDLVERRAGGEDAAEDFFDLGLAAAGVEESYGLAGARASLSGVRGPRSAVRFRGK